MFAKMLLPRVGGAAGVWTACLLFFQCALVAAYGYAHAAPSRLGEVRHAKLHVLVLLLPAVCLPLAVRAGAPAGGSDPTSWTLGALALSVGLPFFVLATSTPLLSRWHAAIAPHEDPYALYAASNAGSLFALVAYPLALEPLLSLRAQSALFTAGYAAFACVVAVAAIARVRTGDAKPAAGAGDAKPAAGTGDAERAGDAAAPDKPAPTVRERLRWIALAFVPSCLMLGATAYVTTDIASAPMLWLPPLALYLLSFVIVFGRRAGAAQGGVGRAIATLYVGLVSSLFLFTLLPLSQHAVVAVLHLLLVFVAGIVFHGELARRRPTGAAMQSFYLWMAFGGALGGVASAIVAPLLFRRVIEYPLVMAASLLLVPTPAPPPSDAEREAAFLRSIGVEAKPAAPAARPRFSALDVAVPVAVFALALTLFSAKLEGMRGTFAKYGIPVGLCLVMSLGRRPRLAAGFVAIAAASHFDSAVVHEERSFFGVSRVEDVEGRRVFFHGTTIHGRQNLDAEGRRTPLDYFDREGPVGELIASLPRAPRRVGVVGLGVGALAAFSEPGQSWTFYEIDAAVERVARGYFTYLADARGNVDVVLGDGRLLLERAPDHTFDLLFMDAFASDAIPTHLLTREAIAIYGRKLADDGVVVFHVTNRYVRLERVLSALARDAGLEARLGYVSRETSKNGVPGTWIALGRSTAALGEIATRWRKLRDPGGAPWTDDHTNLLGAILDR